MKKELTKIFEQIDSWIGESRNILVITHVNPDGDAIGSLLALYLHLLAAGKQVQAMTPNDFPDFLKWLPRAGEVVQYMGNREKAERLIREADLMILLDFNDPGRLGKASQAVLSSGARKILIDHHPDPSVETGLCLSVTEASSTAELVYHLVTGPGDHRRISQEIATCLYTGIMTDTGCFSFNSSRPGTFRIVAGLLETGLDKDRVYDLVYNNFSSSRMKLLGYSLYRKMKVLPHYHAAYLVLSQEEQKEFGFTIGDAEGFVNYPLSIKGIIFSVLVMEKRDHIKLSFRSKGSFRVNELARDHFKGGGHDNAAGGESYESLEKTVSRLEKIIAQYAEALQGAAGDV